MVRVNDPNNPYRAPNAPLDHLPSTTGFAACPKCGAQSATKVGYNWWGGALGPRLFHVVKCNQCRSQFNGKTGGKLTKVIIGYQAIVLVVMIAVWVVFRNL
jgi:hypothetical protein